MKVLICFIALICFNNCFSIAQDSTEKYFRIVYFGGSLGIGGNIKESGNGGKFNISVDLFENYFTNLQYCRYTSLNYHLHVIDEGSIQLGKRFKFAPFTNLVFSAGPAYLEYQKPVNIKYNPPSSNFLGISNNEYYNFDVDLKKILGFAFRTEIEIPFSNSIGLSFGILGNINKEFSYGFGTIGLIIGNLRKYN